MRRSAIVTLLSMAGIAALAHGERDDRAAPRAVAVRLTDARTGATIPGWIRVLDGEGRTVPLPELLGRGLGLPEDDPSWKWHVLPRKTAVKLPGGPLVIEAISGLETERARIAVDLSLKPVPELSVPLRRFRDLRAAGWKSANTHLHLQKIGRDASDRYLREVPAGDDLDLLFVSYLERAGADREYVTNRYVPRELTKLGEEAGVPIGWGEEHRHNFTGFGEGYGHVMFLDLADLIQPVSLGPGITQAGTDGVPLQRGLDLAKRADATVLWCHNHWGVEAIPSWITGRIDAQNIFDGGEHGSFEDGFYRYLDAGLRVPFSTGTDWFQYDFSRVYVPLKGTPTPKGWLAELEAGRSWITNGPLLEFDVDGQGIGSTLRLERPRPIAVRARAAGRADFRRLELVRNGVVVEHAESAATDGHFTATLSVRIAADEPCWLTVRTPPPPVKGEPAPSEPFPANEFGRPLFAHTSPVYVEVAGRSVFRRTAAESLLAEMRRNLETIAAQARFADETERARVVTVHREAIALLEARLKRAP